MNEFINAVLNPNVPFIRYALIAGLLSSIPFGIIGSFVVVKRMTYVAGAISHSVLGGIGLALFLSASGNSASFPPLGGALLFALLAGLIISITLIKKTDRLDTVIGTIWAVGMSLGLIFIYLTPGYINPMSYLFGNILLVTKSNLILIVVLDVVITALAVFLFNQFVAVAFDAEFASIRGLNSAVFEIILVQLVALTVVLMINIVGIVMVIALLTIPPAIAGLWTKRMKYLMAAAVVICAFIMTFGLVSSYSLKLPTGSTTVMTGGILYALARVVKAAKR